MRTGFIRSTLLAIAVIVPCSLWAEEPKEVAPAATNQSDTKPKDSKPAVYDEQADPQQQIDTAVRTARHRNQRVLLSLGGNWCGWCIKLHKLFDENQEIAKLLDEEFVVGWIDSANLDKVAAFGAEARKEIGKHGVPFLVVLDADGKVLALHDTGSLEEGPLHDPAKVTAFLKTWVAPPGDAETLLAEAESRAKETNRRVLVQIGSSGCGWCHRLEDFVLEHAALFDPDYVYLKINISRMSDGMEVAKRLGFGERSGVPWSAILDGDGKVLATSDGPQGNVGYPGAPHEIEHFISMLNKTAQHSTPAQIAEIEKEFNEAAKKLRIGS